MAVSTLKPKSQNITQTFPVTGMTCASCAMSVESILGYVDGVTKAEVNLATNTVKVEYAPEIPTSDLQKALQSVGYDLIVEGDDINEVQEELQQKHFKQAQEQTLWAAVLTVPVFTIGMFFMHWGSGRWVSMALTAPVVFVIGRHFFANAWKQARHGKANMDTLVALSTSIAFLFSLFNTLFPGFWTQQGLEPHVYYEAAAVIITFISLGKLLEEKAKSSTTSAIKKLIGLQPKTIHVWVNNREQDIPLSELTEGQTVIVKPGEKVPADGQLSQGQSFVDESMISGEPVAVEKQEGDKVFAGTINQKGSFRFVTEQVGNKTLLAQIIQKVQDAQGSKAPVEKLVNKIAGIFVPIVLLIAILTFCTWIFLGGDNAFTHALLTSVAVLVIACPCALGLATPTAVMVGMGRGAENNILIRDAESLEIAHKVNTVVLDKTGTITQGKPQVTDHIWSKTANPSIDAKMLLAMEKRSEHPLAQALVTLLEGQQISPTEGLRHFQSVTGKGIEAIDESGNDFIVGNLAFVNNKGIFLNRPFSEQTRLWQKQAKTVVFFADSHEVLGAFAIADPIKPTSKAAIEKIQSQGINVIMLTGDNQETAHAVAAQVGITEYMGETLPSDKADYIKSLHKKGRVVAMVGDGINDAEALALADVSIAMGHGSDIAMDVAKITLITSDLESIPKALKLSKRTVSGIRQNLFWAFVYNVIGIPIAAGLLYPINGFLLDPMIAGAAMALSSVSVVTNSLRLKRVKL